MFTLLALLVFLFGFYEEAYAYLDPSTGSYILQIVLAGLLGALFKLKIFWSKIRSSISRLFSGRSDEPRDRQ